MATYYVDPVSGNNSNAGTSFALAFATTAKAESVVAAGDTVRLCATGTESLTSTNTITLTTSGSGTAFITWQGYNNTGTTPLSPGSYYTIDGSGMNSSTDVVAAGAITSRRYLGVKITNAKRLAFSATAADGATYLENCSITNPTTSCFGMASTSNGLGWTCINCVFTGSGAGGSQHVLANLQSTSNRPGVNLIGCTVSAFYDVNAIINGAEMYRNNIFANNGTAIYGSIYLTNGYIENNVFYGNTVAIGVSDRSSAARYCWIINNTFVNNTTAFLAAASNNQFQFEDYNHFYNNGTIYNGAGLVAGANDISGNPLFNNAASLDFRLKAGSPLIGAGLRGSNIAALQQIPATQYSTIFGG